MSTVMRRSPVGRPPGARATALALAGLLAGGGQFTSATHAANADAKANGPKPKVVLVAQPERVITEVLVVDGGRVAGQTTPEAARKDGLTVVNLSDDWLPFVFSETQEKPQPLRPFLQDLANGRMRASKSYARPREDRFFEAFGIFPSLNLVRRRLADKRRHACHDKVKDAVLEELAPKNVIPPEEPEKIPNPDPATVKETPMIQTGRTLPPRPLTPTETRAVIAMQAHLRCEELLSGKASSGRMDRRTAEGLRTYQRLHMLADNSKIDLDTRTVLMGDSREHDFRTLLRVLRERVVDATGLLEDGSALGVAGQVQGRVLDSPEFLPLALPAEKTPANAAATAQAPAAQGQAAAPAAAPAADASAKITAAPDLDRRGHARGQPGAGLDVTGGRAREHAGSACAARWNAKKPARKTAKKGPAPLPTARRDQAAAAAAVPRAQDGAPRGDRSRRRGAGAAAARQGRQEEVEASGRRPPDADAVRAQG